MARLTDPQRLAWLRLIRTDNVGSRTFHNLLDHFGSAEAAIEAWPDLVSKGGGQGKRLCSVEDAEREIAGLERLGAQLIALGEPDYPSVLAESDGAPPLLTVLGGTACFERPIISIVGARNASAAGRSFAAKLAADLGRAGFAIASGLARGIDTAAHEASLATGTIAVLAGGPDRIYPAENAPLLQRILKDGAAVTEMPLGWEPRAKDFPRRNRIIAGLARGVVVVEAALRSGSLITARLANELGREVMAAPGSPLDVRCEGSNALLRDGATLITSADHVIEALGASLAPQGKPASHYKERGPIIIKESGGAPAADDGLRALVLELLGPSPAGIDDIVRLSGAPARTVQLVLLELEMAGRLERHLGGRISLIGEPTY
ncbi:DNA processing protein DprA [Terrihabitans soli]|uniref:DNA processing protein DprA n=1 Tax=Terrihabitans soli TaxID=708113 RepID=A0A6S6QIP5_9HYPH|nr:DNA-processing protein DprA [Terrihabitans soli]BCJ91123.1 DNA processing protein DprA [Terrihabitans soli]